MIDVTIISHQHQLLAVFEPDLQEQDAEQPEHSDALYSAHSRAASMSSTVTMRSRLDMMDPVTLETGTRGREIYFVENRLPSHFVVGLVFGNVVPSGPGPARLRNLIWNTWS